MKARRIFYEGLASMLAAGIPIRGALEHAVAGAGGDFAESLRHLHAETTRGRPLADAMAERPGMFPRHQVEMIRAAETGGNLDRTLRALATTEAANERNLGIVIARVAYPLFVIHFTAVPVSVMRGHTRSILDFVGGCLVFWVPLWVVLGAGWLFVHRARSGGAAGRILLGIPVLGNLIRDGALVRWARVFAALEDAGVTAERCTEMAAASTGFAVLEAPLAAPAARIREGVSRADAFAPAGLPADLYQALAQGEISGTIAAGLGRAADAREQASESRTTALLNMLPAVATVIAGAFVAWAAISMMSNFYRIPK